MDIVSISNDKQFIITDPETNNVVFMSKVKSRSITNRGEFILSFLNPWLESKPDHAKVYINMFKVYEQTKDPQKLLDEFVKVRALLDVYINEIDYKSSVQYKTMVAKKGKSQIVFSFEEACDLARASCFIKAILPFISTLNDLDVIYRKRLFMLAVEDLSKKDILSKVYKLIKSKVFGTTLSSHTLWSYLGFIKGSTPDSVSLDILRSVLETILATAKYGSDPITYMASFVKSAIEYIFTDVYTDSIMYVTQLYVNEPHKDDYFESIVARSTLDLAIIQPVISENSTVVPKILNDVHYPSPIISFVAVPFVMSITGLKPRHFHDIGVHYHHILGLYTSMVFEKYGKYPTLRKLLKGYVTENALQKDRIYSASKHCESLCSELYASVPHGYKHLITSESENDVQKLYIDKICGVEFGVRYLDIFSDQPISFNKKVATKEMIEFLIELFDTKFERFKITSLQNKLVGKGSITNVDNLLI